MKRLAEFIRSVAPADPFQLLFVLGAVFLFISSRLPWLPRLFSYSSELPPEQVEVLRAYIVLPIYLVIFAGLAAYFICFWPGENPLRRVILAVCVPSLGALVASFALIAFWSAPYQSVLMPNGFRMHKYAWLWTLLCNLTSGFHSCLLGLMLVSAFTIRMRIGMSKLPLALPGPRPISENDSSWRRTKMLIYFLVGPLFLIGLLALLPLALFPSHSQIVLSSTGRIGPILDGVLLLGISLWIAGADGRELARRSIQLPEPKFAVLGLGIAVGLNCLIPSVWYVFDRIQWSAHDFGRFAPPQLGGYFDSIDPWFFLMGVGAFAEEVVFRGVLQFRFVQRYGVQRGIFLTTIVWAAIHFHSDSYSPGTDGAVLFHLGLRIYTCIVLGYVFAWMTLRSGSVIPSGICHAVHNILVFSQHTREFPGSSEVGIALWAICAYLMFRYWPVSKGEMPSSDIGEGNLDPAT